jgi:carboxymethylenebutenolidase
MHRTLTSSVAAFMAGTVALAFAACEKQAADKVVVTEESTAVEAAAPSSPADPERPVDAESLPYAEVSDKLAYGYFAFPSDMAEPLPAVLLIHDWWGLDEDMRSAANKLAAVGYMVLAVDLYGGETVSDAAEAREKSIGVMENTANVEENLRQAIEFVDVAGAPSVGVAGWGIGGGYALSAAVRFPDLIDAVVVFYGQVPGNTDRLATLDSPVLGLFGAEDTSVTPESVEAFAAATHRLGSRAEIEIYEGAGHGFADPKRARFDAAIAARAWTRMLDFLAENLASADES